MMTMFPLESRFSPGAHVVVLRDIKNDGSYRTFPTGELLAEVGDRGRILGVGLQDEPGRVVYFVGLSREDRVIGCFEEDLLPTSQKVSSSRKGAGKKRQKKVEQGA